MRKYALISSCGTYRYSLTRLWDDSLPNLLFIMLNPSTADSNIDDPTIRRCISFAKDNGFGSVSVGNLYSFRSTDPSVLKTMNVEIAIGPENSDHLEELISHSGKIIVAWGKHGGMGTSLVRNLLAEKEVFALQVNKDGSPKHPLYISSKATLKLWKVSGGNCD